MTQLSNYQNKYSFIRFRREDGILEMAIHRNGGTPKWDFGLTGIHGQLGDAFYDVGRDRDNKVMIFTNLGDNFMTEFDFTGGDGPDAASLAFWDRIYKEGKDLLTNLLDIECPVISATNGHAYIHSEIPVLADIVLASDTVRFADKAHFPGGAVPGDGVHVVWPMLLGPNRGRYFLFTGQEIDAQEALRLGVVAEVLPRDKLMSRAWELARGLLQKSDLTRRYTRAVLTQHLKRRMVEELSAGLIAEGLAMREEGPRTK